LINDNSSLCFSADLKKLIKISQTSKLKIKVVIELQIKFPLKKAYNCRASRTKRGKTKKGFIYLIVFQLEEEILYRYNG
jgi:hypothetical protein